MANRLHGKRVLVTQAADYMGPATVDVFREEGADVVADDATRTTADACRDIVTETGHIDVLVANLASPNFSGTPIDELADDDWRTPFALLVDPLHWFTQAVLPQMIERQAGKIVVYGSATALRGLKTVAAYSAARAAQVGYVQAVGVEVAPHNVQVNLIARTTWRTASTTRRNSCRRSPSCVPSSGRSRRADWERRAKTPSSRCSWRATRAGSSPARRSPSLAAGYNGDRARLRR